MNAPAYPFSNLCADIEADILACVRGASAFQPARLGRLRKLSVMFTPPLLCTALYRLSHWCWSHGWRMPGRLLATVNRLLNRADIHPASHIGGGLYIPHTAGIIFEGHAGQGLSLLAHAVVTVDVAHPVIWLGEGMAPCLGDQVSIGTFAVVKGDLHIGDRVSLGQGAIVLGDVPDDCIVVGAARTRLVTLTSGEAV